MKRFVEKMICAKCKKEVFGLWKKTETEAKQDYIHKHNMSAFCDYNTETKKIEGVKE